ncbi:MAG: hypothetical protein COA54_09035 [Thiotrichaceae bacterium]|nr:MAG: hypothetical protein COA54_09035 [Thiotrichaceae bacterium]
MTHLSEEQVKKQIWESLRYKKEFRTRYILFASEEANIINKASTKKGRNFDELAKLVSFDEATGL